MYLGMHCWTAKRLPWSEYNKLRTIAGRDSLSLSRQSLIISGFEWIGCRYALWGSSLAVRVAVFCVGSTCRRTDNKRALQYGRNGSYYCTRVLGKPANAH